MAQAVKKLTGFTYKLKAEQESPDATVFHLMPLTSLQFSKAVDLHNTIGPTESAEYTLTAGLRGWDNFKDADGLVKFTGRPREDHARLTIEQINELSGAIYEASILTESERKN
jgi:hypothetical protein